LRNFISKQLPHTNFIREATLQKIVEERNKGLRIAAEKGRQQF
jgi:hypothetical protein